MRRGLAGDGAGRRAGERRRRARNMLPLLLRATALRALPGQRCGRVLCGGPVRAWADRLEARPGASGAFRRAARCLRAPRQRGSQKRRAAHAAGAQHAAARGRPAV